MTTPHPFRRSAIALAALVAGIVLTAPRADAQALVLSFTEARTWSPYGVGTLSGGQGVMTYPVLDRSTTLRFGASQVSRVEHYLGTLCSGLINPATCPPEPLERKHTMLAASLGLGRHLIRTKPVQVQLFADGLFGELKVLERALDDDQTNTMNKQVVGARAGVEGWWWPSSRVPLGLVANASREQIKPLAIDMCADCWQPIRGSFGASRLSVGVVIGRRPE